MKEIYDGIQVGDCLIIRTYKGELTAEEVLDRLNNLTADNHHLMKRNAELESTLNNVWEFMSKNCEDSVLKQLMEFLEGGFK